MEIIPAIYLLGGRCVALYKGKFEQKETYSRPPLEIARNFVSEGAAHLYVVELDGKEKNTFEQRDLVFGLARLAGKPVLLEAGFGSLTEIEQALAGGIAKVILRPDSINLVSAAVSRFGADRVYGLILASGGEMVAKELSEQEKKSKEAARRAGLGILQRHGETPFDGSQREVDIVDYAEQLIAAGIRTVVYRDERSEGTMIHPNYDEVDRLRVTVGDRVQILVSGGISEARHIEMLQKIGASGAIIGKALYERAITLHQARAAIHSQ